MRILRLVRIFIIFFLFGGIYLRASEFAPHYPDYEQMVQEIYDLAEKYPNRAEVVVYGKSVEGRDLLALHIFLGDGKSRPGAMVCGNIHGNEMVGNRMAMAIAKRLLQDADSDPWIHSLLEKMEFWILPCLNPDGYYKTVELYKKGDLQGHRKNANQVDLNRNFFLPGPRTLKINWAGSDKKEHPNYHGPYPLSEPETQAIKKFMDEHKIFASINFHSVAGVLFPTRCTNHRCAKRHWQMGKAFIKHQKKTKYIYVRWPRWLDTFTGEMEDMQYHFYGTLAIDIEIGRPNRNRREAKKALGKTLPKAKMNIYKEGFWAFNPINLDWWIENDRDATLYALEKAYEITGGAPIPEKDR